MPVTDRVRIVIAALGLMLAGADVGCSSSHPCQVALADAASSCLPTFDNKTSAPIPCPEPGTSLAITDCPDRPLVLEMELPGTPATYRACFYDRLSHQLVGVYAMSPLRVYCGNTSDTEDSGEVVLGPCDPRTSTHVGATCQ